MLQGNNMRGGDKFRSEESQLVRLFAKAAKSDPPALAPKEVKAAYRLHNLRILMRPSLSAA
jgi:hypothetical protein